MTSKFQLDPAPTFKATVQIPIHGGNTAPVVFEFKHVTKDEYNAMFSGDNVLPDVELVMKMCAGWDLDDEFNAASVEKLRQNYQQSMGAIVRAFVNEIGPARLGN